jgi:hypothetical protein
MARTAACSTFALSLMRAQSLAGTGITVQNTETGV